MISRSYLDHKNKRIIVERKYTMGKRRKPSTPRKIKDPAEAARVYAEGPNLWTLDQPDVTDRRASLVEGERRVERFDCFRLMLERAKDDTTANRERTKNLAASLPYVRRYQADVATYHKAAGSPQTGVVVDFGRGGDELAHIAAGERLRLVESHMGAHSAVIMRGLSESAIGTMGRHWRATLESITGERNAMAQGALIRAAMLNTMGAYHSIDEQPRRKAG